MSRLERLVVLLDTGSTSFIRNTAADQLADLAANHHEETLNLLGRVYPFLKSKKWETRVAASRAVSGIIDNSPSWDPNSTDVEGEVASVKQEVKTEENLDIMIQTQDDNLVSFAGWDLHQILKSGQKLLASSGNEYTETNGEVDTLDSFKRQKSSEDSKAVTASSVHDAVKKEEGIDQIPASEPAQQSARMRALARRKAKAGAKINPGRSKTVDLSQSSVSRQLAKDIKEESGSSTPKPEHAQVFSVQQGNKIVVDQKPQEFSNLLPGDETLASRVWPFQGVLELLIADFFSEFWEIRHGAAMGLRDLMRKHGSYAGRVKGKSLVENNIRNARTLEDLCVRILTLFALDKFGDYVSDTVIAPVRENAAQALAAIFLHLSEDVALRTFQGLSQLVLQNAEYPTCWEAKHGGMLGLRYFVSVRTDMLFCRPDMLSSVIDMVLHGLRADEDVQSVAASTLIPIAKDFVKVRLELVFQIVDVIWDCLTDLRDDLSASIGSVMDLLAKLCSHQEVLDKMKLDASKDEGSQFQNLIPRLYPFLRHSITNVRKAVLRTLWAFLTIQDPSMKEWIDGKSLRLLCQNLLVEQNEEVLRLSEQVYAKLVEELVSHGRSVETVFSENLTPMLSLLMTPIGVARYNYPMNTSLIARPSGATFKAEQINQEAGKGKKKRKAGSEQPAPISEIPPSEYDHAVNIDAPIFHGEVSLLGEEVFVRTKLATASALGLTIAAFQSEDAVNNALQLVSDCLTTQFATSHLFAAVILEEFFTACKKKDKEIPEAIRTHLSSKLLVTLNTPQTLPQFKELVPILRGLRTQCLQLLNLFMDHGKVSSSKIPQLPVVVQGDQDAGPDAFGISAAENVVGETYTRLVSAMKPANKMACLQTIEDAQRLIQSAVDEFNAVSTEKQTAILAAYAAAFVSMDGVPKKLNSIIRALMDSVKIEKIVSLQSRSSEAVAILVNELLKAGKGGAVDKLTKNLCGFLCVDTSEVPEFVYNKHFKECILSLKKEQAKAEFADDPSREIAVKQAKIKRRGAQIALETILNFFDERLFEVIPKLYELMIENLALLSSDEYSDTTGQAIVDALGVLRALLSKMNPTLQNQLLDKLPAIAAGLQSEYAVFRYSSAKCISTLCAIAPSKVFPYIIKEVLPLLGNAGDVKQRQGAIECVYHLSNTLGASILPFVIFLIIPVLGRMSDADNDVRILATTTFASIIKLVPLEAGIPDPADMPADLLADRDKEREFIQQMMDPSKIKPFDLPVSIKATLRHYQQEGVNWLAFLNKYHLHGILADDMGLGKTLQTICIVASDHHIRAEKFEESHSAEYRRLPSLVICPPSLTGHWEQEFNEYSPLLKIIVYAGKPSIRNELRSQLSSADVVVTSYDVARNDIEHILSTDYNYCVLDEGHTIKNAQTKLTKCVKRIHAEHRLILSGTPIQNNVVELWSLFDFLMPGFLGTEKVFQEKFARPIAASRNGKPSSKEEEAGALAAEALHKQVLPFMLRRLKEDVLSDLPPKIIQDYYCELSDLQKQLYRDFTKKQKVSVEREVGQDDKGSKQHIFQALQYMRKLCNHPALLITPRHPQFESISKQLALTGSEIRDVKHSPKLVALQTLLNECGIGTVSHAESRAQQQHQLVSGEGVISQHRVLIFCQLKDMLDMVEVDLFNKCMPSVTYMRLDGSTEPRERQDVVRRFNRDPSIDVLLLTTKVGGLGLNLTGADTVIFVEHDWNPMNDLQAMDRAHRIGQKKVVNVYRLITKDTLEEKIMGLQKFKMNIASTVVNQQNSGLNSMDTTQLLDLFDVEDTGLINEGHQEMEKEKNSESNKDIPNEAGLGGKAGAAVGELGELWDEAQYAEEYNLDSFIKTLK